MSESGKAEDPAKSGWTRLWEIGPLWITAITGLIVALTGAGFLVGHVTGSTRSAAPQPTVTVTRTVPAKGSSSSPSNEPSPTPSAGTYLTQLTPLEAGCCGVTNGPVQMGTKTYQQSVSFGCGEGAAEVQSVVYDVAGFAYFDSTIGIPDNSPVNSGGVADIVLYKNGSSTPLGPPISGAVGKGQAVHVNLQGATQLTISCSGALATIALGNGVLSHS